MSTAPRMLLAGSLVFATVLLTRAGSPSCLTMKDLQRMNECELAELYARSEVGTPFSGRVDGKILTATDAKFPKLRVAASNLAWKGKNAEPDGHFVNRWVGGVKAIGSQYQIAPSWVDGKLSIVMEYSIDTKLLWNMHDEVREVAPGLYMGPYYDRCPCPKFRGYLALQVKCGPCEK